MTVKKLIDPNTCDCQAPLNSCSLGFHEWEMAENNQILYVTDSITGSLVVNVEELQYDTRHNEDYFVNVLSVMVRKPASIATIINS